MMTLLAKNPVFAANPSCLADFVKTLVQPSVQAIPTPMQAPSEAAQASHTAVQLANMAIPPNMHPPAEVAGEAAQANNMPMKETAEGVPTTQATPNTQPLASGQAIPTPVDPVGEAAATQANNVPMEEGTHATPAEAAQANQVAAEVVPTIQATPPNMQLQPLAEAASSGQAISAPVEPEGEARAPTTQATPVEVEPPAEAAQVIPNSVNTLAERTSTKPASQEVSTDDSPRVIAARKQYWARFKRPRPAESVAEVQTTTATPASQASQFVEDVEALLSQPTLILGESDSPIAAPASEPVAFSPDLSGLTASLTHLVTHLRRLSSAELRLRSGLTASLTHLMTHLLSWTLRTLLSNPPLQLSSPQDPLQVNCLQEETKPWQLQQLSRQPQSLAQMQWPSL